MQLPEAPPEGITAGPMKNALEVSRASTSRKPLVGHLSEGGVAGHVSALFGLPEPFTAITCEPVSVLWISMADRPLASWPKDVVMQMEESVRSRLEWHHNRLRQSSTSQPTLDRHRSKEAPQRSPEWKVSDSRFLRNKDLEPWKAEMIRDVYHAEGWVPPAQEVAPSAAIQVAKRELPSPLLMHAAANESGQGHLGEMRTASKGAAAMSSRALPRATTPTQQRALTRESGPDLARPSSSSAAARPRSVAAAATASGDFCAKHTTGGERGVYNVNAGIGRCKTPWGTWNPSGMLPVAAPTAGPAEKLMQKVKARRKVASRQCVQDLGQDGTGEQQEREPVEKAKVNFRLERDWRRISSVASSPALEKMYKRQVRATMVGARTRSVPAAR